MASWLVLSTPDRVVRVRVPAGDIVLCSWTSHFTLTVPLSTQVYKLVPADLMLGVTLRWTSIPSRGKSKYSQWLHATVTGDKRRPEEPSRLLADFTFTLQCKRLTSKICKKGSCFCYFLFSQKKKRFYFCYLFLSFLLFINNNLKT